MLPRAQVLLRVQAQVPEQVQVQERVLLQVPEQVQVQEQVLPQDVKVRASERVLLLRVQVRVQVLLQALTWNLLTFHRHSLRSL